MLERYVWTSIRMAVVTIVLLGVLYPFAMTLAAHAAFPAQANGSLVRTGGAAPVGSALIGQRFATARYFHGRPSAAGGGYDASASGASNLAPTSRALVERVRRGVADETAANPGLVPGAVPVDMVTASGSGLDPDITLANASAQVARVAAARGMTESAVRGIVQANVTPRQLGVLGEQRVNVLALNLALDAAR